MLSSPFSGITVLVRFWGADVELFAALRAPMVVLVHKRWKLTSPSRHLADVIHSICPYG